MFWTLLKAEISILATLNLPTVNVLKAEITGELSNSVEFKRQTA